MGWIDGLPGWGYQRARSTCITGEPPAVDGGKATGLIAVRE